MEREIYVVVVTFKNGDKNISSECYDTKEKAIEFCESRLTEQELENVNKAKNRGLACWYEFWNKNYNYDIKVLTCK